MPEPCPVDASARAHSLALRANRRYRVFLSYSHSDTTWARWLMRRLETYAVPRRFHGRTAPIGVVDRRIAPVFRDRDELPTTSDLGETIRAALRESATLVVICSPASARSRWVQEEITAFKRLHGERGVFAFIVSGEPKVAGAPDDCFSPALRAEIGADGELSMVPAEVVAADARREGDGPKLAFVRLVAGLLGVGFDELRQRELQRRNRRLTLVTACSIAGMALTLGLAAMAWQARNEAVLARNDAQRRQEQAEDVLSFMLGDFRADLKKVGQLDLLDRVGNKASEYFDSLDARDLTDTALARHAKALTQIGEIRMEQKDARYADALLAFSTAYQRAAALVARHPQNADMLFERAQAEYWIGFVYWKQREFDAAREWCIRYRDSALALLALEGPVLRARREAISGYHNLAVLDFERGNLQSARAGFLAALAMKRELLAVNPGDAQLQFRVADALSWLGTVAERSGEFAEAAAHLAEQTELLEALVKVEPGAATWRHKLANSGSISAELLGITGRRKRALDQLVQAERVLEPLTTRDPANRRWQLLAIRLRLLQAEFSPELWKTRRPMDVVIEGRRQLERLVAGEPQDASFRKLLGMAWRLEAEITRAHREGDAGEAAGQAVKVGEALISFDRQSDLLGACAAAHVIAGQVAQDAGQAAVAGAHWYRALEIVESETDAVRDWRVLDPAARALALLGRVAEGRVLVERLHALGYQPLRPWPEPLSSETKTKQ